MGLAIAANAVAPIGYAGDPVQRGLARLPTLFTPADAIQGIDTNVSMALEQGGSIISDFVRSGSASGSMAMTAPMYESAPVGGGNLANASDGGPSPQTTFAPRLPTSLEDWRENFEIPGTRRNNVPDLATANDPSNAAAPSQSAPDRSAHDCSDLGITDFATHPIDSANCLLDRFLFGVMAIALVILGIWLFAKD